MSLRSPAPTAFNTYQLIITPNTHKLTGTLFQIDIMNHKNAAGWLFVFTGSAVPADHTVPAIAPIPIAANAFLQYQIPSDVADGLMITGNNNAQSSNAPAGIVLVMSSSGTDFTQDNTATVDIVGYVEEWEARIPPAIRTKATAGSLTVPMAAGTLGVWSNGDGPYVLKKLEVVKTTNAVKYLVIYAVDTPDANSLICWWAKLPLAASADRPEFNFGQQEGFRPFQQSLVANVPTNFYSCTVCEQVDLTPGNVIAVGTVCVLATYSAPTQS